MPETLHPEEINALLAALKEGRIQTASSTPGKQAVSNYDLTSQDRIIRGQMPTLDAINEQIASMLASGLSGRTRMALRVTTAPAALFKFIDFSSVLQAPSVLAVLSLGGGYGHALLVLEPGLAEAMLAAALGDRKPRQPEPAPTGEQRRELTSVEQLVLRRLLAIFTDAMTEMWAPVLPLQAQVLRFEPDPRMAAVAPPNDVVIVSTYQVTAGVEGRLQLVIPYSAVEVAKQRLSSPPRMNAGSDERFAQALGRELEQVEVEVCGLLGHTTLSLERLLELEPGDVLTLTTDEQAPLPLTVEGRVKLLGQPRVQRGAMVVELTSGVLEPRDQSVEAA
jgi:flagellar motor switch protein FliM